MTRHAKTNSGDDLVAAAEEQLALHRSFVDANKHRMSKDDIDRYAASEQRLLDTIEWLRNEANNEQ